MSRTGRHLCRAATVAAGALLLVGCLLSSEQRSIPINVADGLQAEFVVPHAEHPAALAFVPDGRILYTEKNTGKIRVIADNKLLDEPFATVPVNFANDRGLLGIAVHPNFNLNQRVYVFYTRSDTGLVSNDPRAVVDQRVVYFEAGGDVAAGSEVFVASIPAEGDGSRVGGLIGFTDGGTLLVAIGDQGNDNAAQDPGLLYGKILRYNDDGTIPGDNPDPNSPVYARGLRFPQGLGFDPITEVAFVTDRNASRFHEINRIEAGKDYGWPTVAGVATSAAQLAYAAETPEYANPILDSGSSTSPLVGATFNPSTKYGPDNRLYFFYGEQSGGRVFSLELSADRTAAVKSRLYASGLPTPITDVVFTPSGTLYVASEDAILRIVLFP